MKFSQLTIGQLMFGIAMPCIPFAIVRNVLNGRSLITGGENYDLGLWPGLVAFLAASIAIVKRRGKGSPFLWGFATMGWASLLAYLACCLRMPWIVDRPIVYYFNRIDYSWTAWLIDSDRYEIYALNLLVFGLFMATPQLIAACVGGLIARSIWGARWTTT